MRSERQPSAADPGSWTPPPQAFVAPSVACVATTTGATAARAALPARLLAAWVAALCALALLFAVGPTAARAADGDVSEADGVKIEHASVSWITPDTVDDGDAAHLSLAPTTDDKQTMSMRLIFSLSGETSYQPGTVRVIIPKNILAYRDGSPAGTLTLPYPAAPDSSREFSYVENDDSYVLTNTGSISGASQHDMQFSIRNIVPHLMNGNPAAYTSDPFQAVVEVTTPKGTKLTKTSNGIDASIDTSVELRDITVTPKDRYTNEAAIYPVWPDSWPEGLRPENASEYVFTRWLASCYHRGNQSYSIEATADAGSSNIPGTKILGMASDDGKKGYELSEDGGQSVTMSVLQNELGSDIGYKNTSNASHYTYLYVAYQKDALSDTSVEYTFKQEISYTLTPADDTDAPFTESKTSSFKQHVTGGGFRPKEHFKIGKDAKTVPGYAGIEATKLMEGEPAEVEFEVRSTAYFAPWTWDDANGDGVIEPDEVGKKPIEVTTDDAELSFGDRKMGHEGEDYEFSSVAIYRGFMEFYDYVTYEEDEGGYYEANDGTVKKGTIRAGSPGYRWMSVEGLDQPPTFELSVRVAGGDWEPWATVEMLRSSGYSHVRYADGSEETFGSEQHSEDANVRLPEKTTALRCTLGLKAPSKIDGATYVLKPKVRIKPSEQNIDDIKRRLDKFNYERVENTSMLSIIQDGTPIYDTTASTDAFLDLLVPRASVEKQHTYKNDVSGRQVQLHYTVSVTEQVGTDKATYDELVDAGVIVPEKSGTFYDLLPPGVVPDVDSVTLRKNDIVRDVELKPNFRDSGRTLMVVRADLSPVLRVDESMGKYNEVQDEITLKYDATYSWEDLRDRGSELTNVVAFESGNDRIMGSGNGEPDDPTAGNRKGSADAVAGVEDLMTDLDPDTDKPAFIYARDTADLVVDTSASADFEKTASINGGAYGMGVDGTPVLNASEGGSYSYRLRMENAVDTGSTDIVFYDKIEGYVPAADSADAGDVQWRGAFESVDVSQLEARGIAPVVYYSTQTDLTLDDTNDRSDNDLDNAAIWSTTPPADLSQVTAIAIDARTGADGQPYVLGGEQSIAAYIYMRAPQVADLAAPGEEPLWYDGDAAAMEGEAGMSGGAHAYNNAVRIARTVSAATGATGEPELVRHDYTKVGLATPLTNVEFEKVWVDNDDAAGLRPDKVTIALLADGTEIDTRTVGEAEGWKGSFTDLPMHRNGKTVAYTLSEKELPAQYMATVEGGVITNTLMKPAQATIKLRKELTSRGTPAATLPDGMFSFRLSPKDGAPMPLGKDGKPSRSMEVGNAADGTISFDGFTFDTPGSYSYEIWESVPAYTPGITYDEQGIIATVTVAPGDDAELAATVSYKGGSGDAHDTFVNEAEPAGVTSY